MPTRPCLNCDAALPEGVRYCPHCGQRADTARLSFVDMAREFMRADRIAERSPLKFARALLRHPGRVAREYVEGRRRRHFGPFATLAVMVGVDALAIRTTGFRALAQEVTTGNAAALLYSHFDLLQLAQLPLLGAACALLFRGQGHRLPEHMALVGYALAMRAAAVTLLALLAVPLSIQAPEAAEVAVFWAAWYGYFGWCASQFYDGPRLANALRGALCAALGHGLTFAGLMLFDAVFGGGR
ncbi:MAG: DUF3667 domain-containing protein [Rubrivivax sp.]